MDCSGFKDTLRRDLMLMGIESRPQTISFQGSEDHWSNRVVGNEVCVEVGPTDHTSGSSAITTRNITNYPWDHHYLPGNLVAQHCSGDYLAYAIKAPQKTSGMVRIIHSKSGDRGLVKNIRGMLRDLAFAYISNRVILAFTDQFGTLYVVEVKESTTAGSLDTVMLLEVNGRSEQPSDHHRVIWCPYIPDDQATGNDDADDPAYLLVLTHGPCAEIWNIGVVVRDHGQTQVRRDQVTTGYQLMEQHSEPITDAAFSPDGTALATAALDGYIKFFQVYMADEEKSPRCLHQWNPHDGKPLSALFFLDNHKHHSPDVQFWKYAVTGACNNSELRVWSCESWQCHQTLRFMPKPQDSLPSPLAFKAAMDPTANFLMLSDIHRRVMYVILLHQDGNSSGSTTNGGGAASGSSEGLGISGGNCCVVKGTAGNSTVNDSSVGTGGNAQMVSVSELPVQYPALSLAIKDAAWKNYKRWKHDHAHDTSHNDIEEEECDEGAGVVEGVVVRCVLINTKSLQEATLRFQPDVPVRPHTLTPQPLDLSLSHDSMSVRDGLTDLSLSMSTSEVEGNSGDSGGGGVLESQPPPPPPPPDALTSPQGSSIPSAALHSSPASQQPPMNLLTPDSFSSPRKLEDSDAAEEGTDEGSRKVTPVPGQFEVPYNEFENAALSMLLRCGSGTLMQSSDTDSSASLKILGSVVAGSSTSPPATTLPPPPTSPLPQARSSQSKEDGPLATSEVGSGGSVGRLGTSTTSSPSLEVQQILHSQNGKSEEYGDEEEEEEDMRQSREREMAEDEEDGDDEEEEEEEEPEALRQPLPQTKTPPKPETLPQPVSQSPSSLSKPPSTLSQPSSSLPQPPSSLPQPSPSLTQPPSSLPQPPSSLPQPPSSSLPQPQSSLPQPPSSLPQSSSLPQPPSSLTQAPSLIPQPASSLPQQPSSQPQPLMPLPKTSPSLAQSTSLSQTVSSLPASTLPLKQPPTQLSTSAMQPAPSITHSLTSLAQLAQQHSQHEHKATPSPLDLFASVRNLPSQLTCEQLEAEIKAGGTVSPDSSGSAGSSSHASNVKRPRGFHVVRHAAVQANRNSGNFDNQINGPVTPGVTASDLNELKTLMTTCVNLNKERSKEAAAQTQALTQKLDKALYQVSQLAKQVEDVRVAQARAHMELPGVVATALRPVLEASVRPALENTLRNELRSVVLPGVVKSLEPLKDRSSQELHMMVKNAESQIVDALTKIIHSRSFVDSMGGSVTSAVSSTVQGACRESYSKLLLPGLNALTQQIFSQVNENFSRGTREYIQLVENEVQTGRSSVQESLGKASQALGTTCTSLGTQTKTLQDCINKMTSQQNTLSDTVVDRVRGLVKEEVQKALQEHQTNIDARSRAHTPAPTPHAQNPKVAQKQVQTLIQQGQFNTAFKQALSASDLSLVMFVCERVNPQQVFSLNPFPLSQDVLLSLVNQLSHDLSTFTDLKIKYLEEAVMNLDSNHPVTREHMRPVLQGFQRNLNLYLGSNPSHKRVKMLLMAVNHLVAL